MTPRTWRKNKRDNKRFHVCLLKPVSATQEAQGQPGLYSEIQSGMFHDTHIDTKKEGKIPVSSFPPLGHTGVSHLFLLSPGCGASLNQWQNLRGRPWKAEREDAVMGLHYAFLSVYVIPVSPLSLCSFSLAYLSSSWGPLPCTWSVASSSSCHEHKHPSPPPARCRLSLLWSLCSNHSSWASLLPVALSLSSAGGHAPWTSHQGSAILFFTRRLFLQVTAYFSEPCDCSQCSRQLNSKLAGTLSPPNPHPFPVFSCWFCREERKS